MAQQVPIAQVHIDAVKGWLKNELSSDNGHPGTFLNNESYFDSLPNSAKVFICAIHRAGPHPEMAKLCRTRASAALAEAKQRPTRDNYDAAIAIYALTVLCMTSDDPARAEYLSEFGHALQTKWEFFHDSEDFNNIVHYYSKAVDVAKPDHPALGAYVTDLAVFLSKRYDQTKKNEDREEAKRHFLWAIELSKNHPLAPIMMSNAGDFIRRTVKREDPLRVSSLSEACQLQREATQCLRPFLNLPYATIRRNAGIAYHDLFCVTREETTSDLAIEHFKASLASSSSTSSMYDLAQNELVEHYMLRQRLWDRLADLNEAHTIYDEQIKRNPEAYLSLAGKAECYRVMGSVYDKCESARVSFETARGYMDLAIEKLPQNSNSRAWLSFRKSSLYYSWFENSGDLRHLHVACEEARVSTEFVKDPNFWDFSRWHAEALLLRYNHLQSLNDLEVAFNAIGSAIQHVPDGATEYKADCDRVYGKCLLLKYSLENQEALLDAAISHLTAACTVSVDEKGMTVSRCLALNDLGNAYCKKFDHSHSIKDLNKAIQAYQQGFDILSRIGADNKHPDYFMLAAGMGYAMFQRFIFWGAKDDITAAVKHYQTAISNIDSYHRNYALRASNLSYALQQKFSIDHDIKHLKHAQSYLGEALAHLQADNLVQWRNLHIQMGNVYMSLFIHAPEKKDEDLDRAEECYMAAMNTRSVSDIESEADTEPNIEMAMAVTNLAILWRKRAERSGKWEDFAKSLEYSDRASTLTPSQNPRLWNVHLNKATTLTLAHEKYPSCHYGEQSLELFKELTRTLHSAPSQAIQALEGAASMEMALHKDAKEAFKYYSIAIEMLPEVIMLHSSRLEQLRCIRNHHTIPSSATALSIQAGNDPKTTVQTLESSRAFIWNRILAEKSPITRLRDSFPELADEFESLRASLMAHSSPRVSQMTPPSTLSTQDLERLRRQDVSVEYSELLRKIREKKDFQDFLQPSDALKYLQNADRDGPIIYINFSKYRSDAIIIGARKVYTISLPSLNMDELLHYALRMYQARIELSAGTPNEFISACEAYNEVMTWLWKTVARPILDKIDYTEFKIGDSVKPRVAWVSSGWLSLFPIHAAGDFQSDTTTTEKSCVYDRVVSSYTPSLLVYTHMQARSKQLKSNKHHSEPLLVGMKHTPSKGDLNIEAELLAVRNSLITKSSTVHDSLIDCSSKDVAAKLKTCTSVHFATHGIANPADPSESTLLLQDWKERPLNVRSILKTRLQDCNFAFLSACESALNKDLNLRDEGIHLAGAFHMAGVPHVVASMWMVGDDVASNISGLFYERLGRDGEVVDWDTAAWALDGAVCELRRQSVPPILWGAFVHSGP
ncbi:hypothetical protein MFRU_007g03750 [Monilinia fructicola]|nr:hypothetical protein MFRU_007g03750 [Monilinia fructicola]